MQIDIHLIDGHVDRFVQDDLNFIRTMLEQVQTGKFFEQPSVILVGRDSLTTYPGSAITRIDFIGSPWPLELIEPLSTGPLLRELSNAEWHARHGSLIARMRQEASLQTPGEPVQLGIALRLEGQPPIYIEVETVSTTGLQQRQTLNKLFEPSGNTFCRRRAGGLTILNRTRLLSCQFSARLDAPSTAWTAEPLREPNSDVRRAFDQLQ